MKSLIHVIPLMGLLLATLAANCQNDIYNVRYQTVLNANANPPTYNTTENFVVGDITSDYGRREHPTASKWHRGIDYNLNNPLGDHILSINDANIQKIGAGSGYKYIITGGDNYFGYGHIFTGGEVSSTGMKRGDMVLKKMYLVDEYAIINLTSMTAIGRTAGITNPVVEYPEGSGDFITVTDEVELDDPVAIIGNSGTDNVHLHLYLFYDVWVAIQEVGTGGHNNVTNNRDPMYVISHPNTEYELSIETNNLEINNQNFIDDNDVVIFPGDDEISLMVKYYMIGAIPSGSRFTNAVMDIDDVGLYIKPDHLETDASQNWGNSGSNCQLIMGKFVESFLSHGSKMNSEIQPITANSDYGFPSNPEQNTVINIVNNSSTNHGSTTTTGIDPYAYRDGNNQPYDDYYFSDFYTRIHDDYQLGGIHNFAAANCEAKYKDGKYQLFAKATTVRGDEYTSIDNGGEPSEIIIDNFKPFIKKVEIFKENASQAEYSRAWVWASGQYLLEPFPFGMDFSVSDDINIVITTSETMNNIELSMNGYAYNNTEPIDEEKTIWNFEVAHQYIIEGENHLIISGTDLSGNAVQNFATSTAIVPIRTGNTSWTPPATNGPDDWHFFFAEQPQDVDFAAEQLAFQLYTVQFTDQSAATPITSWEWDFGDGSGTSWEQNPVHQFPGEDTYPVTLTIIVNGTPYICEHDVEVDDLGMPSPEFIYSIGNSNKKSEITVDFLDQSVGMISSWEWVFDDGQGNIQTSNLQNPTGISFLEKKDYDVSLTVYNAIGDATEEKEFYYDPAQTPYVTFWEYGSTYFNREFDITSWNLSEPFTFEIDYGDGIIETADENQNWWHLFEHQYANTGWHTVVASVTGTGSTGDETAYAIKQVNIQSFDLDIELSYVVESLDPYYINPSAGHSPPYPYQPVTISTQVTGAGGNPYYTGNWLIRKTDDPDFFESWNISGTSVDVFEYQFPETGIYVVNLVLNNGSSVGQKTLMIDVNTADQYVDVALSGLTEVATGYEGAFDGSLSVLGEPGLPEQDWWPTNLRWTLRKGEQVLETYNDDFPYTDYSFNHARSFSSFNEEGTYILRLETWNNEHGYDQNDLINIKYVNSLPFYDYTELEIIVTNDLAFLKIIEPEVNTINLGANEVIISIIMKNTGNTPLYWQAKEGPYGFDVEWIEILFGDKGKLNGQETDNIVIQVDENEFVNGRYSGISLSAFYDGYNGNEPVPATYNYIYLNQMGIGGPDFQVIEPGDFAVDDMGFGEAVAIYENYAVVGAPGQGGGFRGSAFVLTKNQYGIWAITAELVNTLTQSGFGLFGRSVDCHGKYIIVGAHRGMAIYKRPENGWIGEVTPTSEYRYLDDSFGSSVAIWGDYAVVGSPNEDVGFTDDGKARIFFKDAGGYDQWGLVAEKSGNGTGSYFGTCVDIYNDIVAIGGPHQDDNTGYIDIYNRNHQASNDWGFEKIYPDAIFGAEPNSEVGKIFDLNFNRLHYSQYNPSLSNQINIFTAMNCYRTPLGQWISDFIYTSYWYDIYTYNFVGNPISSIAILPNIDFYHGYPTLQNADGDIIIISENNTAEIWTHKCGASLPYDWYPLNEGDMFGKSLNASLTHTIIGAPGKYSNQGSVLFERHGSYESWCETEYDLEFVNFEKLPGNYDDVIGRNIKIGGQSYPAVIKEGANITYEGTEIILRDGFIAENGSEFTARSTDCNFQNESAVSDQPKIITSIDIMPLFRNMVYRMPEYPWNIFGAYQDIDEIIILNEKNEIIIQSANPDFKNLELDFINTNYEELKTILVIGDKNYLVRLDGLEMLLGQSINSGNKMAPSIPGNNHLIIKSL